MARPALLLSLGLTALAAAAFSPPAASFCDEAGWTTTWADEFDGASLDNTSWTMDLGGGDSRVRDSMGTAANVYLENGTLVLRSQVENVGGYNHSSGGVQTRGKKSWSGPTRVCVRAQLPGGGGGGNGSTSKREETRVVDDLCSYCSVCACRDCVCCTS